VSVARGAAAKIVAVATGNPKDVSDVLAMTKKLWHGKALAIVQPLAAAAPGPVTVKVSAAGVPDVEVVVTTTASGTSVCDRGRVLGLEHEYPLTATPPLQYEANGI
jgi:hypothetical protein